MIPRKTKPSSLYKNLEEELRNGILSGRFSENSPFPSESEVCRLHGLSRTTVRKAFQRLTNQNFLRRVHGVGTFIIPKAERNKLVRKVAKIRIVVPFLGSSVANMDIFDRNIVLGIDIFACLHNYEIELALESKQTVQKIFDDYHNFLIDGVIWLRAGSKTLEMIRQIQAHYIPQTVIARDIPHVPGVFFDCRQSMKQALDFLKKIGHHEFHYFEMNTNHLPLWQERGAYFDEACEISHCKGHWSQHNFSDRLGMMAEIQEKYPETTAVIVCAPLFPALSEQLKKNKWKIPEDLTLIQLGQLDDVADPPCTTIKMPLRQMGEKAAELITEVDYRENRDFPRTLMNGELVFGPSISFPEKLWRRKKECEI